MNDNEFLNWLADRLVNVYGESSNVDFVLKLRALAQPAVPQGHKQEPVAWPVEEQPDGSVIPVDPLEMTAEQLQRYTTPPTQQSCSQRQCNIKPLTDEQRKNMGDKYGGKLHRPDSAAYWYFKGIDDTEAAHGIVGETHE